jgi:argininosuccinate lyase
VSDRAKELIARLQWTEVHGDWVPTKEDATLLLAALRLADADDTVDACPLGCAAREFMPLERTHETALAAYRAAKEQP